MTATPPEVPTVRRRSLWERASIVWMVPLTALIIALGVAWQNYANRGPLIEIAFEEAAGIHAGETEMRYRDITVGLVEEVAFSDSLDKVIARVRLDKEITEYADADARFWIVRPQVTTQGVSGLDTVLSGVFIEASWDTEPGGFVAQHEGALDEPMLRPGEDGLTFKLTAAPGVLLVGDTPILHKGIEVGRIGTPELGPDDAAAQVEGVVYAPYDRLVSSSTRFWDTSGFSFSFGPNGAEIDYSSIASLIAGGVAFGTLVSGGDPVEDGAVFEIYADESAARASLFSTNQGPSLNLTAIFEDNFAGLTAGSEVVYDGVRVGEVSNLNGIVDPERFGDPNIRLLTTLSIRTGRLGLSEQTPEATLDFLASRVSEGMRARLANASLLTGGLRVELVTLDESEPATLDREAAPYPIVPTAPAEISDAAATAEGVLERINNLKIEELIASATDLMDAATALARDDELGAVPGQVNGLLEEMRGLVGSEDVQALPGQVSGLIAELQQTTARLGAIATQLEEADAVGRLLAAIDAATAVTENVNQSVAGVPDLLAQLTAVAEKAERLPVEALVTELTETLASVDALLATEGTRALPATLNASLDEIRTALAELRAGGAVESLNSSLASAESAAGAVETAAAQLPGLAERLDGVLAQATETLAGLDGNSDLNRAIRAALREVQNAARAVEELARTLERRPNSVIMGK